MAGACLRTLCGATRLVTTTRAGLAGAVTGVILCGLINRAVWFRGLVHHNFIGTPNYPSSRNLGGLTRVKGA